MSRIQDIGETGHVFSNWASTYSCRPELYFEPSTTDELRQILAAARSKSKKVRVVGKGCSPSDIVCTSDYMISMSHFNKVLQVDKKNCTVVVESGVLVSDLNEILADNGLALGVLGSISFITLVGAISTGVHGTGINYGIMSSYVKEVTLMKADGDVITVSRETDETTFLAACVSLGALGVILSVKVQCEPAFHLEQLRYGAKRKKVMDELNSLMARADHLRMMWYPHTDDCTVFETKRTEKPIKRSRSWFWEIAVSYHLIQFLYWLSTFVPLILPAINWFCVTMLESQRQEIVDRSDRLFNFDCLFDQYVMEWAFPREKTVSVIEELKQWIDTTGFKAHFPIEIRFTKADDIYLSPCYGQDSCYINIVSFRPYGKEVPHERYWKAFQHIVFKAGGRPHWAKDHTLTSEALSAMYPCWKQFQSVRQRLDPDGMFTNANLERVLGTGNGSN